MLGYIEKGKAEGARALVGGGPATQFDHGFYVQPTLFVDVDPDSTIAQEEIFGPVLSVIAFEDDDDAVRIAEQLALRVVGRGHERLDSTGRWQSPAASVPARSR